MQHTIHANITSVIEKVHLDDLDVLDTLKVLWSVSSETCKEV